MKNEVKNAGQAAQPATAVDILRQQLEMLKGRQQELQSTADSLAIVQTDIQKVQNALSALTGDEEATAPVRKPRKARAKKTRKAKARKGGKKGKRGKKRTVKAKKVRAARKNKGGRPKGSKNKPKDVVAQVPAPVAAVPAPVVAPKTEVKAPAAA